MRGADRALWEEALEQELASIDANGTWEPARLPPERVALTCKLVFKRKRDAQGRVCRYRIRLVVQGYLQKFGVDYDETFCASRRLLKLCC